LEKSAPLQIRKSWLRVGMGPPECLIRPWPRPRQNTSYQHTLPGAADCWGSRTWLVVFCDYWTWAWASTAWLCRAQNERNVSSLFDTSLHWRVLVWKRSDTSTIWNFWL